MRILDVTDQEQQNLKVTDQGAEKSGLEATALKTPDAQAARNADASDIKAVQALNQNAHTGSAGGDQQKQSIQIESDGEIVSSREHPKTENEIAALNRQDSITLAELKELASRQTGYSWAKECLEIHQAAQNLPHGKEREEAIVRAQDTADMIARRGPYALESKIANAGAVIDYQPTRTGEQSYALGMDYEEVRDSRSIYEKLAAFGKAAAARASDLEGQKAYIQGQLDKIIGIGEGLNIAKDSTKAAVVVGWTALTDGTVANFLAKPNAINDPMFHAVGGALDAMAKDPNAANHALEQVGTIVMNASENYTVAPNREKGHVIGETMFGLVNPEGSTEGGELALKIADGVATPVDDAVMKLVMSGYKSAEDQIVAFPKQAESIRKLLYDSLQQFNLTQQQLEYASIPKGYFDGMQAPPGAGKGDNFFAMSKADDLGANQLEGESKLRNKAGAGGDWPVINERPSLDVVKQADRMSCVSAVGEMLTSGEFKQASLIKELGAPCDIRELADILGPPWKGTGVPPQELDKLIASGPWAAELREPVSIKYRRSEPGHSVVVDGLDELGNIKIRDPAEGTRYEMTRKDFLDYWTYHSVFKR